MSLRALVGRGPVHFVGIGGAGMSALARILRSRAVAVTGSDVKDGTAIAALRAVGASITIGHAAPNVGEPRAVVVSSAIRSDNPELAYARSNGIPILHRAQLLALLMKGRRGIAVAGTHGKTTTSSMIALILHRAGLEPGFVIGGDLNESGTNAADGRGDWFVAEADESDGSFLWLAPQIAVINNIEADHLDHYGDESRVRDAFRAFAGNVRTDGLVVMSAEDPGSAAIREGLRVRVRTVGIGAGELTCRRTVNPDGTQRLEVERDGARFATVELQVPGEHNARNALAAIAVADEVGVDPQTAASALASYEGVRRRFQMRGTAAGVTVVDDYAHHPTEVAAVLAAAREGTRSRVVAVFQPHLYSRTRHFADGFGAALATADLIVVTDVYGAREDPEPGVTGKLVVDGVLRAAPRAQVAYLPKRGDIVPYIAGRVRPGDLVLTLGAGDVTMLGDQILHAVGGQA